MNLKYYIILIILVFNNIEAQLCPKECDCDMKNGLNRAMCTDQNIVTVDIGVPKQVQVYSLSNNVISELDNYVFKEIAYTSLKFLDLSNNHIFWIGLHAFSGLKNLTNLSLNNNRLNYIPSDLFIETPELENLDLSANHFETLKNEPFIMHDKLKVLNLRSCRIKLLPDRMFTRLPNLRKLDLSDNYMISMKISVLTPLRKLDRVELKSDYWKCTKEFQALERWLVEKNWSYDKQCKRMMAKMSEKIISAVANDTEIDVGDVWNITKTVHTNSTLPKNTTRKLSPFEQFDHEFSAMKSFILGIEIGLAIGIVGTYIWLRSLCKCGKLNCRRPESRRARRRRQRADDNMMANLLYVNTPNPNLETPPSIRRQTSLSELTSTFPTYGLHNIREASELYDIIRPGRSETPPPPYNECRRIEFV